MTSVIEPAFDEAKGDQVGDWHPRRWTRSLSGTEEFPSAGAALLVVVDAFWTTEEGKLRLDEWQVWLILHVLEQFPDDWPVESLRGKLRYRRVMISMGRQNGKSVIASILALFFLTRHVRGPRVSGFASIDRQAKIVYNRVRFAIEHSPQLSAVLKTTRTRGIEFIDGKGSYDTYPASEDSVQGEPFSATIYDELHLGSLGLWDAIVLSQRSKPHGMICGFTTAGDDNSLLLKRLYIEADEALAGDDLRFGVFIWESVTEDFDTDYEPREADVIAANPSIACGRVPLDDEMASVRKTWKAGPDEEGVTGRDRVIRYTMNRFVAGATDSWVSAASFKDRAGAIPAAIRSTSPVFAIDRTESWERASITATWNHKSHLYTELVAAIGQPTIETLEHACRALVTARPGAVVTLPNDTLKALARRLRDAGIECWVLSAGEIQSALDSSRGAVKAKTLTHANDTLVRQQSDRARVRKSTFGARLSRTTSTDHLDALRSMHLGIYVASARPEVSDQLH